MVRKSLVSMLMIATLAAGVPVAALRAQAGGPQEGIKVHGHWVVDVRNVDGSLASHTEFENALQNSGGNALTAILGRFETAGTWTINLNGGGIGCLIVDPADDLSDIAGCRSGNLHITRPAPNTMVLDGTVQAIAPFTISTVATAIESCPAGTSVAACNSTNQNFAHQVPYGFTSHDLGSNGIAVVATQMIQVTVTISFS